ncbi:hypothetical protein LCGC14_3160220, partial [marine sediment metagenome]
DKMSLAPFDISHPIMIILLVVFGAAFVYSFFRGEHEE